MRFENEFGYHRMVQEQYDRDEFNQLQFALSTLTLDDLSKSSSRVDIKTSIMYLDFHVGKLIPQFPDSLKQDLINFIDYDIKLRLEVYLHFSQGWYIETDYYILENPLMFFIGEKNQKEYQLISMSRCLSELLLNHHHIMPDEGKYGWVETFFNVNGKSEKGFSLFQSSVGRYIDSPPLCDNFYQTFCDSIEWCWKQFFKSKGKLTPLFSNRHGCQVTMTSPDRVRLRTRNGKIIMIDFTTDKSTSDVVGYKEYAEKFVFPKNPNWTRNDLSTMQCCPQRCGNILFKLALVQRWFDINDDDWEEWDE